MFHQQKIIGKDLRKNSVTIALNVLYAKKEKKTYPASVSKHNSSRQKLAIPLMIPNGEKRDAKSEG